MSPPSSSAIATSGRGASEDGHPGSAGGLGPDATGAAWTVAGAGTADQDPGARLEFLLWAETCAGVDRPPHPEQRRHRVHRTFRLRQEHVLADVQSHERHHPRDARRGRGGSTATTSTGTESTSCQLRRRSRHGLSEIEPVSQVDLRQRRLRPAHQGMARITPELADRVEQACARRRSGRKSRTG